jgi:predicted P-loop ATPase
MTDNDKPDYFTDAEWAEFLRDHPDLDKDKVVRIEKGKRQKKSPSPPPPPGGWPPWFGELRTDERGRVYPDLRNVLIALRREPKLADAFAFDEMLQQSILKAPMPLAPDASGGEPPPKAITDDDIARLQEWLQHVGLPRIGREVVGQAVELRAREFRFHPVREQLNGLVWDRTPRMSTWLKVYLGATGPAEYLAAIGEKFLIAMVARIFQPGCKCDYMLVLDGDQGVMKSLACKILAGEAYFSDDLGDIAHKDAKQHLRGKWLVEESELANISRAATETLKSFISRTTEKYRPPYAKAQVEEPRQCVIVGTTNRDDYSKDETGARRLLPVKLVGRINIEALKRDRDQLFAEAVDAYRRSQPWWPDPDFEAKFIKPQQEARRAVDAWDSPIGNWLAGRTAEKVTVMEVAEGALFMLRSHLGTADQNRIKACMSLIGWKKDPQRTERGYVWWFPPKM